MASQQGALRRAFFSRLDRRLLAALLISTALHAALLPMRFVAPYEQSTPRPEMEVRFNRAGPTRVAARAPEPRETSPRPVELKPLKAESPVLQPPSPPAEAPPVAGLAVPQQLPIPFPGNRPMWSFDAAQTANAQAAYQAQAQQQARLAAQAQLRAARGQYEALLTMRLRDVATSAACRIVVPGRGAARAQCDDPADGGRVDAALRDMGRAPPDDAAEWLFIALAPGAAGDARRATSTRAVPEPASR